MATYTINNITSTVITLTIDMGDEFAQTLTRTVLEPNIDGEGNPMLNGNGEQTFLERPEEYIERAIFTQQIVNKNLTSNQTLQYIEKYVSQYVSDYRNIVSPPATPTSSLSSLIGLTDSI